jgi:putative DNA methylase
MNRRALWTRRDEVGALTAAANLTMTNMAEGQLFAPHMGDSRPIDGHLPAQLISRLAASERYSRGKTPHTIFVWWARRPLSAVREVVTAALNEEVGLRNPPDVTRPRLLDMFGGGGTISLEAAKLGVKAHSVESNELAHFASLALLELSQVASSTLPALVHTRGRLLLTRLSELTDQLFPARAPSPGAQTIAYFWTRSLLCPGCSGAIPLHKRSWLSKKGGKKLGLRVDPDTTRKTVRRSLAYGDDVPGWSSWAGSKIRCPFCDAVFAAKDLRESFATSAVEEVVACCHTSGRGKHFELASEGLLPHAGVIDRFIDDQLRLLGEVLPTESLPQWSGVVNPPLYGISRVSDLFNRRQLAVMLALCRLLHEEFVDLSGSHGDEVARAATAFLSGLIDQLVDWNCRISMWISENEQVGRALSGPGIPMLWDYAEIDPIASGPANLWDKLNRIVTGLRAIPKFDDPPVVVHGDARSLPFEDASFDLVVTDPPYFDNLFYNVLADCIYVWKRLALKHAFPNEFTARATNGESELSASAHRHGGRDPAFAFYTAGMTAAFREAQRVVRRGAPLVIFFGHSAVQGWASLIQALHDASFELTAVWPLQLERRHRPRGMRSAAVNTTFVLVCRSRSQPRPVLRWEDFASELGSLAQSAEHDSTTPGADSEMSNQALFAGAVAAYSRTGGLVDDGALSCVEVIERIAAHLEATSPGFAISRR